MVGRWSGIQQLIELFIRQYGCLAVAINFHGDLSILNFVKWPVITGFLGALKTKPKRQVAGMDTERPLMADGLSADETEKFLVQWWSGFGDETGLIAPACERPSRPSRCQRPRLARAQPPS